MTLDEVDLEFKRRVIGFLAFPWVLVKGYLVSRSGGQFCLKQALCFGPWKQCNFHALPRFLNKSKSNSLSDICLIRDGAESTLALCGPVYFGPCITKIFGINVKYESLSSSLLTCLCRSMSALLPTISIGNSSRSFTLST